MAVRVPKTSRVIGRLLEKERERCGPVQGIQRILEGLQASGVSWDELMLALSNLAFHNYQRDKKVPIPAQYRDGAIKQKVWRRFSLVLREVVNDEAIRRIMPVVPETPEPADPLCH